jgi:hypothetical protein
MGWARQESAVPSFPWRAPPGWLWREGRYCRWVEVEHLGAGELPRAQAVEAEYRAVEDVAGPGLAVLPPQHDDLLAGCGDHVRVQAPKGGGGL